MQEGSDEHFWNRQFPAMAVVLASTDVRGIATRSTDEGIEKNLGKMHISPVFPIHFLPPDM